MLKYKKIGNIMNERDTLKINAKNHLEIGGVDTLELAQKYGTPLYVFDVSYIKNMCQIFSKTLKDYYGDGIISYASKAFSCKEIYRLISKENMGADVVSGGELYTALSAGFSPENLYFHGYNKTDKALEHAIKSKVKTIIIDSFEEADTLDELAKKFGVKQEVFIRINPGVEAHTHHYIQTAKVDSKFGFSISNGDALDIVLYVKEKKNLNLTGLHCHIGSQIFEKKSFAIAVDKMTDFYKLLKENHGVSFDKLNLGGGFGIYYSEGDAKLSYNDYAEYVKTICEKLNACVLEKGIKKPFLILEPGRSIVGEAGITLYTAGNTKIIKNIKNYLSIDGGMFDNPRFALYQAKYTVVPAEKMRDARTIKYTIAGKCCESGDIIAEDVLLPKMQKGDIIAVLSTGAYNYSMASNYNRNFVPPVVFVNNGESYYAVKPQTFEDITRNDI